VVTVRLIADVSRSARLALAWWGIGLCSCRSAVAVLALVLAMASVANAAPVTLRWDSNNDGITEGYLVYYGTASGVYQPASGIDVGNVTQFQADLQPGQTYYFAVRAYSSTAGLGPASTELSFTVPSSSSINVSASSVVTGGTVTATIGGGPGGRLDWVGVFAVGASNSSRLNWKYLNNTQTAPATGLTSASVSFVMPTTPGQYQLRFFAEGAATPLATSATITVTAPVVLATIVPSVTTVGAGGTVTVVIANASGSRFDWVALYPTAAGATPIDWKYLNGLQTAPVLGVTAAIVTFTMPATAGTYTLRLMANNTYTMLAITPTITVTGTPPSSATITPSATTVAPGGSLTVTIANGPGSRLDWVALYPTTSGATFVDWKYLNGSRTAPAVGVSSATLTFTMPTTPGTYTLRLLANNTYTLLATTAVITVTNPTPPPSGVSITPSATTVAAGGTLTVTIANGPGSRLDWVALYPTTASGAAFIDWKYLNGLRTAPSAGVTSATLTFVMPTTPGTYTLRLLANNTYTLLASTTTITVTSVPVGPSITPSVTTIAAGGTLTVTIANGPGSRLDWVALYPTAGGAGFVDWKYLNGATTAPATGVTSATVTFTMPATAGTYTLRFLANNTYTLLATTGTITTVR
jgi:uncharacterized protein YegP (UPF0339 family)